MVLRVVMKTTISNTKREIKPETVMDALEALMTRKSIRNFLDREIPRDVIEKILRAGAQAPNGGNCQPWRFVVVTDQEKIK